MENNKIKIFEIISFVYFFIGAVCEILIEYTNISFAYLDIITKFYMFTFMWISVLYLIIGCILCKHRHYLMNIIDSALCFCLIAVSPFPIFVYIYDFNKYLYYSLGLCFSCLPLIFCIIDKTKINSFYILKTITRIFLIIFTVLVIIMFKSCGSNIAG